MNEIPFNTTSDGKVQTIRATCYKDTDRNMIGNDVDRRTGIAIKLIPNNQLNLSLSLSENEMDYMVRDSKGKYSDRWAFLQKPNQEDKAMCITANICKGVPYNICAIAVRLQDE